MAWSGWKFMFIWGFVLLNSRITHQIVNLALDGVAAQSSMSDDLHPPSLAIDGKPHTRYVDGSCISTQREENPWWRLDLGREYDLQTIQVIRRSDCCSLEFQGVEVLIGNSLENNGTSNPRCAIVDSTSGVTMVFHCKMSGRYIVVFAPGVNKILHLCEVKVYPKAKVTGANLAVGRVTAMSSKWIQWVSPSMAIDGGLSTEFYGGSCAATAKQDNPWWRVDLGGPYNVISVEFIRRTEPSNIHEIEGAEILIGNSLLNNGSSNPRCGVITVTPNHIMKFNCKMTGRYVIVYLRDVNRVLTICELKVNGFARSGKVNLAYRGLVTQSGKASAETSPIKAVDKLPSKSSPQETCASVPLQDNPWWRIDLRSIYRITLVSIFIGGNCSSEELNGAEIRIGFRNDTGNPRCAVISTADGQCKYNYLCGEMEGRFIYFILPGLQKTLTLCELEVDGMVLENVAMRGVAFQSTSELATGSEASRAIDGNSTTCSTTETKPGQWLIVDLLAPYNVTVIQLDYKKDCCFATDIRVDNTSCKIIPSGASTIMNAHCGGIVGRHVTIMHSDKRSPLCEVDVYSTWTLPKKKYPQPPPPQRHCSYDSCAGDYVLVHDQPKTWFEAQTYCRLRYSDLATITNPQDLNRVIDKMEKNFNDFWIGLYEDVITWRWSLSDEGYYADSEAQFRNWGSDVGTNEKRIHHCAGIQDTGEWKDLDCDLHYYFLCYDGRKDANSGQTKILVGTTMKWAEARHYCRAHHTDLLSVRNQAENDEIRSMVPPGKVAWIGLFGDSWKWSNGSSSLFRYWSDAPLDGIGEGPNCASVHDAKWRVRSCNTKSMFLCDKVFYQKQTIVKIKANVDLTDRNIQAQIMSKMEAEMRKKGISDFKIRWRMARRMEEDTEEETQSIRPSGDDTTCY